MSSRFSIQGYNPVIQRTPASTLDIYTIVSIFPQDVPIDKPTLDPGQFLIPKGTFDNPSVLHIGTSVWWRNFGAEQEPGEVTVPAIMMANSIVQDFINAAFGNEPGLSGPGLFYLEGRITSEQVKKNHPEALKKAKLSQDRWYENLVKSADSLWARSNGNPIAIPNISRLAAEHLKLENKPWMQDFNTLKLEACPACGALRNPLFPICGSCRTIVDQKLFNERKLSAVN